VLEALGARLDVSPAEVASSVAECGIGFLFAPSHHGALRHAAPVRRALGLRTFFNLLGPLSNPAGATHQLVGVYDGRRLRQIAEVLGRLGVRGAWVVHGEGGLDEISPTGPSRVAVLADGVVTEREIGPEDFGEAPVGPEGIVGGDARENAEILERIFSGEPVLQRAAVVLNAASALLAAGVSVSPMEAASRVRRAIDEGRAAAVLQDFLAHNRRTS
jgi:anthranilate phosphoribosyltransferase